MQYRSLIMTGLLLAAPVSYAFSDMSFTTREADVEPIALTSSLSRKSYSIGVDIARSLKREGITLDSPAFLAGLSDTLSEEASVRLDDQEIRRQVLALQKEVLSKHSDADNNQKIGDQFLAENKLRDEITALPSGLQYEVISQGNVSKNPPKKTDRVKVHYRGTSLDGKEFDSSYARGEPAVFGVTEVIPGWTETLMLMPPGAKWRVYIPSNLAYGEHGHPPVIAPNATLVFEIELIDVI